MIMYSDDTFDIDIDAIMEGTESTIDMIFDEESAFDEEVSNTVISDDIDDMAIENIIGLGDLITDDDIDAIDKGKPPADANDPIDDDAEAGANDPEIFRLQKDVFQNSLLTDNDIKDLREGMSLEEFTGRILKEAEEVPDTPSGDPTANITDTTAPGATESDGVCKECHHSPCICDHPVKDGDDLKFDLDADFNKFADKMGGDDDLTNDLDLDDIGLDISTDDDEINAPANVPAGPVQPLNDGKECGDNSNLPFAPSANEEKDIESLSKLEDEGDITTMFTDEEKEMLEAAYAEGYAARMEELEDSEALDEDAVEEILAEAYEEGYNSAIQEMTEEEDGDVFDEDTEDLVDGLDSVNEGLEDIEIFNKFEGSGINADEKDANAGMFAGWDNTDEPGGTSQNDTTLPFENVTVKGFSDIEDDARECMLK